MIPRCARTAVALTVLGAAMVGACAHRRASERAAQSPSVIARREPSALVSAYERVSSASIPTPFSDVSALPDGHALVIGAQALYRFDRTRFTRVCDPLEGEPDTMRADGPRFLVAGGSAARPVFWSSPDAGAHCTRSAPPGDPLDATDRVSIALDERMAHAWAPGGLVLRSTDAGATWSTLPRLRGVVAVAPGPGSTESTLAAVRLARDASDDATELRVLAAPQLRNWSPLEAPLRTHGAVELRRQTDGSVLVLDGSGRLRVRPDGRVERIRDDYAQRARLDAPRVIVPAGRDRFVYSTAAGVLMRDDPRESAPIALAPVVGHYALDAAADGALWFVTNTRMFAGRVDGGPLEVVAERPLDDPSPSHFAVRGRTFAIASEQGQIARSVDGGQHWSRTARGRPLSLRSLAIGSHGEVLALASTGLFVGDGVSLTEVPIPFELGTPDQLRQLFVSGDRWIVLGSGIAVSDDQGAHWRMCAVPPGETRGASSNAAGALTTNAPISAASLVRGTLFVVDASFSVYRSDDVCSTLTRVADPTTMGLPTTYARTNEPRIAHDGAQRVVVLSRTHVTRSNDGGATWSSAPALASTFVRDLVFAGPTLAGFTTPSRLCPGTSLGHASVPTFEGIGSEGELRFVPRTDACLHSATAIAFDGDWVYLLRPGGDIERVRVAQLDSH